jgi:tripartite-type tricarboxylate transporter receptor subunit TctC
MQRRHLIAAGLALPAIASAQEAWPSKPVRIVVPYPPGGPNDFLARLYAQQLAPILGQQVVVENRAGGSGVIGTDTVLKSAPDGTTFAICDGGSLVIAPHTQAAMPYKVPEDLALISVVTQVPEALVASPRLGVKTLPELLDLAKRQPGRLNIGTAGAAGISHLAAWSFKRQTGVEVEVITYRGAAPAVTDLIAGQIQLLFADLPPLMPHIAANVLAPLALAARRRSPSLPDLATTVEYGFPRLLAENWYCCVGPARLPDAIQQKMSAALRTASAAPALKDALAAQGAEAFWCSQQDFATRVRDESPMWRDIARSANVRAE